MQCGKLKRRRREYWTEVETSWTVENGLHVVDESDTELEDIGNCVVVPAA